MACPPHSGCTQTRVTSVTPEASQCIFSQQWYTLLLQLNSSQMKAMLRMPSPCKSQKMTPMGLMVLPPYIGSAHKPS